MSSPPRPVNLPPLAIVGAGDVAYKQVNQSTLWIQLPGLHFRNRSAIADIVSFKIVGAVTARAVNEICVGGWRVNTLFLHCLEVPGENAECRFTTSQSMLPLSCIESAEHVVRCKSMGRFEAWKPMEEGEETPPYVKATFAAPVSVNVSTEHLEREEDNGFSDYQVNAQGAPSIADGVIIAYRHKDSERPKNHWTCHAAAIVAVLEGGTDLLVIDIYANDANRGAIPTITDWTLTYLREMNSFKTKSCAALGGAGACALGRLQPTGNRGH